MTDFLTAAKTRLVRVIRPMLGLGLAAALTASCTYNEELGRNQLLLGDSAAIASQADQAWLQIKQQEKISTS